MNALTFIALGGLLGAAGQGIRVVVGIKKEIDEADKSKKTIRDWFDATEFLISFVLGAIVGILAAVSAYEINIEPTKTLLLGIVGAGYSGADFIGGLMKKWLPATT